MAKGCSIGWTYRETCLEVQGKLSHQDTKDIQETQELQEIQKTRETEGKFWPHHYHTGCEGRVVTSFCHKKRDIALIRRAQKKTH